MNSAVIPTIAAGLGYGAAQFNLANDLSRTTPARMPSSGAYEELGEAAVDLIQRRNPNARVDMALEENVPEKFRDALDNPSQYSGSSRRQDGGYRVRINPNADRAYFAHELGHIASDQTQIGNLVRSARNNPKMKKALMGSLLLLPGMSAALTEGDDDFATSTALALAAQSPVLLDEMLATNNGLAIMKNAGMRATAGQRARLAGGLMTYLGPALLAGVAGNIVGNQFDEDPGMAQL